ncbi:cyclopropane-fatty-acyl-phospholipid synthase [Photobacterium angustum]|uniref:Class I SAM-dependent methyltransferase n=1 Tax=Photobacterium angustum TaxID=661 RepID=A0ABX5H4U1_PHOAN|nr:cyclopropane-fatty-acyl-phospholipid synthase family protein [Photobacterium angustum]KJG39601.1 cyclopropane-fatty-acyl-phospholipid synthase [Photobacterium angustum]PSX10430.1 class I SAM-dependent methyltransferase [Photobacterium angustum]
MLRSDVQQSSSVNVSASDHASRHILFKVLKHLSNAGLSVSDSTEGTVFFGDKQAPLQASINVHNPLFYKRLLTDGSIGAGEAYMEGWWDSPNLTNVVRVLAKNLTTLDKLEAKMGWMSRISKQIGHLLRKNTIKNARKNISAHYDLGNDLYRHFLDPNMLYSSAIYLNKNDTLDQAQWNKMDRLCQKLKLTEDDHLLEIGTGWGGMAIHAAKYYGCRVTTTTISEQQYLWAKERVEKEGLSDRITLLMDDYRDLTGQYDKLVSVEMIEAVGKQYLKTYIEKCQSLLKPTGLMAIQAITIADQRYDSYSRGVDFIQKHIFPGGFLPSITVLLENLTQHSDFVMRDIKDIGLDYAKTLEDWHQQFNENAVALEKYGYDERFMRMWRFYFAYCEGGFLERTISTIQFVASRPQWRE